MEQKKTQARILDKIRQEVKESFEEQSRRDEKNPAPESMLYIR